jgi:CHAT domain-containing protein
MGAEGIPDYAELKVRIEPGPDGIYRVIASGPAGSTATGAFAPPFNSTELDNFVLRVGLTRRTNRSYRSSQMEEAKRFGASVFDALIKDDVRDLYRGARNHADATGRGLRVTFNLTGAPELMQIPWEFLYERPAFLSQSIYTPIVRSLDLANPRPPRRVDLPLRILAMASRPEGLAALDVDDERTKLEAALGSLIASGFVELDWLERATLEDLERRIATRGQIHVLHYIGHGAYDERTESGILMLEDEHGRPSEVTGEELGSLLCDEHSLRLVVLNACEGARNSHVDPFSGVASSLVERGIPAVVGMQFEITDRAAITFAERLFGTLARSFPVDAALAQARKAIFAAGSDIEFGTPVLFLRGEDARIFDIDADQVTRPVAAPVAAPPAAAVAVAAPPPPPAQSPPASQAPPPNPVPASPETPETARTQRIYGWTGFLVGGPIGWAIARALASSTSAGLPKPSFRLPTSKSFDRPGFWGWLLLGILIVGTILDSQESLAGRTLNLVFGLVFYAVLCVLIWKLFKKGRDFVRRNRGPG